MAAAITDIIWREWDEARLKLLRSKGKEDTTLRCSNCNYCTEIINLSGESTIRLCTKGNQLISPHCNTRAKWCPRGCE